MKHNALALVLVFVSTFFVALGQILFKVASNAFAFSIDGFLLNWFVWLGFLSYFGGLVFFIWAIRLGELTIMYPLLSLSYVWVLLYSFLFLQELFTVQKFTGLFFAFVGIVLLAKSQLGGKK